MEYVEIYCPVGEKTWMTNRNPHSDINLAHRLLEESRESPNHHIILVERGTDMSMLPIPEGKP